MFFKNGESGKKWKVFIKMLLFTIHILFFFFILPDQHIVPALTLLFSVASHQALGSWARWMAPGICPLLGIQMGPVLRDWGAYKGKNHYICAFLPQIKLHFLNIATPSGSWSNVLWSQWKNGHCFQWLLNNYHLGMLSCVCCCPLFNGFVSCCFPHQQDE